MFTPYFFAPSYAQSNGVSANLVDYSIAIMQAGSFAGRAAAGPLADKFGVWTVFGTVTFANAVVIFAFWTGAPGAGTAIAGLVLFGFVSGAWLTLLTAATAAISPVKEIGMRIGMLWTVGAIPNMVGPVICGGECAATGSRYGIDITDIPSAHRRCWRQVHVRGCVYRVHFPARRGPDYGAACVAVCDKEHSKVIIGSQRASIGTE